MNQEIIKQVIQEQQPIRLPVKLVKRHIQTACESFKLNTQIIIIKGIRRCGKSTLLQILRSQESEPHFYCNFDDDRLVDFTAEDFQLLLSLLIELFGPAKILFFDEIQNVIGFERFIRRLHDQGYKIYLTGSSAQLLSRELGTHLTGRYISLEMYPYSFEEYLDAIDEHVDNKIINTTENMARLKRLFNQYMEIGGIPDYVRFEQPEYLHDLYESILYRDIIVRHNVSKDRLFKSLVHYLASHIGKDVSYNNLKNMLGLASATTVSDYCYYLETSYLFFLVNRYSSSLKTQMHYAKKGYFVDHTLAKTIGFRISEDKGRMLENIVFIELKRRNHETYFYRDQHECDFLIKEAHQITQAIQVSVHLDQPDIKKRELMGLEEAMHHFNLSHGLILTENTAFKEGNITVMPVWKWLLTR